MSNGDNARRKSIADLPRLRIDENEVGAQQMKILEGGGEVKEDGLLSTGISPSSFDDVDVDVDVDVEERRCSTRGTGEGIVLPSSSLYPPVDGGRDAWLFLAGCFIVEAMVWGFPLAFGIFQQYYTTHEPFSRDASKVAVIGDTATGALYFGGLITTPLLKRWPRLLVPFIWAGFPLIAVGMLAASYAKDVDQLIVTQGVLTCFGGWMVFYPTMTLIDDWFVRRRGMALGVMYAGTGGAGIVVPYVLNFLLSRYGSQMTLRIWAVVLIIITPCVYWVRPRIPPSRASIPPRQGLSFMRMPLFWLLLLGLMIESLGFPCPSVFLPTFIVDLGHSLNVGTLLIILFNVTTIISTILTGTLVDKFHVTTIIMVVTVGTMISVFVFWGCANGLGMAIVFALSYGFFAGGYSVATVSGTARALRMFDESMDVGAVLGLLLAGKGVGIVLSGPLSEVLYTSQSWKGEAGLAYGSGYGPLIVFTGVTAALGGISYVGRVLKWF